MTPTETVPVPTVSATGIRSVRPADATRAHPRAGETATDETSDIDMAPAPTGGAGPSDGLAGHTTVDPTPMGRTVMIEGITPEVVGYPCGPAGYDAQGQVVGAVSLDVFIPSSPYVGSAPATETAWFGVDDEVRDPISETAGVSSAWCRRTRSFLLLPDLLSSAQCRPDLRWLRLIASALAMIAFNVLKRWVASGPLF